MKIRVSPRAKREFEAIFLWLAEQSPEAARRAASNIYATVDLIGSFPELGMASPEGWREKGVQFDRDGYLIRSRVMGDTIVILRIMHTRQRRD